MPHGILNSRLPDPVNRQLLISIAVLAAIPSLLSAQESEPADSLVRLMNAQSAKMIQTEGQNVREVIGPASFLHNGTYLLCDTAYWYVDAQLINAIGNVRIIQEGTELSGDSLDYLIDKDLAQFRGTVVQLQDKDGNLLRSRHLDYHTKDSVAVFAGGAAMRDKDGQIIESVDGSYDSKSKLFIFENDVNMFSDSIFVRTDRLLYHGDSNRADFESPVDIWKDGNMLSANRGTYDRAFEIFHFYGDVHALGETQEAWGDTLVFDRVSSDIKLYGEVQLSDDSRGVSGVGHFAHYEDSLARVTLQRDAAAVMAVDRRREASPSDSLMLAPAKDTIYLGADRLIYRSMRRCDIDSAELSESARRVGEMSLDAVSQYRANAAEEAAKKAEEEQRKADEAAGKRPALRDDSPEQGGTEDKSLEQMAPESADSSPEVRDSVLSDSSTDLQNDILQVSDSALAVHGAAPDTTEAVQDSISASSGSLAAMQDGLLPSADMSSLADSLTTLAPADTVEAVLDSVGALSDTTAAEPLDTTKTGFVYAIGDVRVYSTDMQARCDSLVYFEMDSLVRMYVDPVIWNEGSRQYSSDSLTVLVKDNRMDKANLRDNAFVVIQEDSVSYDQIKATEMMAYFDSTGALARFDALGSATAIFYIEENDVLATVNKSESKMLSAWFADGNLDRIYYFDAPKNSAYPAVQLPSEDRRMRGFKWEPERCPKSKEDITTVSLRNSQRGEYEARPKTDFRFTDTYFPGYMAGVYREIAYRDSLSRIVPPADTSLVAAQDTLQGALQPVDSLSATAAADTNAVKAPADTVALEDSTWVPLGEALEQLAASQPQPSKKELRRQKREARWAELDARDARKAEAKAARRRERQLRKAAKIKAANEKQAAKDSIVFERYRAKYERQKAREEARKAAREPESADSVSSALQTD